MKLIVGLGNPGKKYEKTRHNIGFEIIDDFAYKNNVTFKKKFDGLIAEVVINNKKVTLLKPQTFMNLSGSSIKKVVDYYGIDIKDILISFDDVDLKFGEIKLKSNSSSGGHNGIKSIIECLKTKEFLRIKFGINNEYKSETKDFVLNIFSKKEQEEIKPLLETTNNIINDFINEMSKEELMNKYNKKV